MAAFHFASLIHLPTEEVQRPQLWPRLRGWIKLTRTLFTDQELEVYGLQNTEAEVGFRTHRAQTQLYMHTYSVTVM